MKTEINLNKYISMAKYIQQYYKYYDVCYSLLFAKNKSGDYAFYRSMSIYNNDDEFIYDFLCAQNLQFLDLKNDSELFNYEPIYDAIRRQKLFNLRNYINKMNLYDISVDENNILEDLHNLPIIKPFAVEKVYAISICDLPYLKKIPNIFNDKSIPSLEIQDGIISFDDEDIYNLDNQLLRDGYVKKFEEKIKYRF